MTGNDVAQSSTYYDWDVWAPSPPLLKLSSTDPHHTKHILFLFFMLRAINEENCDVQYSPTVVTELK
jgi:hypothetical protein